MHVVAAAVPSLLVADGDGVGVKIGDGLLLALGAGLEGVAVTLPSVQSVATSKTIGETKESSSTSFVIPV